MDRIFFDATVEQLEELLNKHRCDRVVLAQLREELGFRRTERAKQLRKEILGLLDGTIPMPPKRPKAARPEDQIDLPFKRR